MPLEWGDPYPDRKGDHPRVGVGRVDPGMRRIAEPIIKELLPAMGTLETIAWTPPQDRRPHRRRVAWWRGVPDPLRARWTGIVARDAAIKRGAVLEKAQERVIFDLAPLAYRQGHEAVQLAVARATIPGAIDQADKRFHHAEIHFGIGHHRSSKNVKLAIWYRPGRQANDPPLD